MKSIFEQHVSEKAFQEKYKELNNLQQQAVDNIEGPVMVLAGAGTGKTQVIALRIAKILLETQINPNNILCLTFTESGVEAMRKRLQEIIGKTAYYVQIHTFHSFCNQVISDYPEYFPHLGLNAQPLKEIEKFKIVKEIVEQLPFASKLKPFGNINNYLRDIAHVISDLKKENISVEVYAAAVADMKKFVAAIKPVYEDFLAIRVNQMQESDLNHFIGKLEQSEWSANPLLKKLKEIYREYNQFFAAKDKANAASRKKFKEIIKDYFKKYFNSDQLLKQQEMVVIYEGYEKFLRAMGKYDFDDMIMQVVGQFQQSRDLLSEYQEQFQYILVDEYQDTNGAQNEILRLLGSYFENPNIFVVGDDDQAIFRFQGASMENLLYFYRQYKKQLTLIEFANNYRSQQTILNAAAALIANNSNSIKSEIPELKKQLLAQVKHPAKPIQVMEFSDESSEEYFVCQQILELIRKGKTAGEIALLCRENRDILPFKKMLAKLGIKYIVEKGEDILGNFLIRQLLKFIDFLYHPENEFLLWQVLQWQLFNLNPLDLARLTRYSYENRLSLFDIIHDQKKVQAAGLQEENKIKQLVENFLHWSQILNNNPALIAFNELITQSGLQQFLLQKPNSVEVINILSRLYQELKNLTEANKNYDLKQFLADLNLYEEFGIELADSFQPEKDNAVHLMTAHGAKGLEFGYVFICKFRYKKWGPKSDKNKIRMPFGLLKNEIITNNEDDERRLFYVALTRGKEQVTISYSGTKSGTRENIPAPALFLNEIDQQYLAVKQADKTAEDILDRLGLQLFAKPQRDFSREGRNYLKNLLQNYQLSVTNLLAYEKCPRCFYFNNILKIPKLKTKSLSLGTAIHSSLADLIAEFKRTGILPDSAYAVARFEIYLQREILTVTDYQDTLAKGRKILAAYVQAQRSNFRADALTEFNLRKYHVFCENVPLTGKIDRIDPDLKKPQVVVVDYKTGNPDTKSSELNQVKFGDYFKQLVFYKILLENAAGLNWTVNKGIISFIEPSSKKGNMIVNKEYELEAGQVEKLSQEISRVYGKILNLEFAECGDKCQNTEMHELPYYL